MYQIKLNIFSDIITDNPLLKTRNIYKFLEEIKDIKYVNNNGFVMNHQDNLYFFRFSKEEIKYFINKEYVLLSYTHYRIIQKYHIFNNLVETEQEKQEYIELLTKNKPNLLIILINHNFKIDIRKLYQEYHDNKLEWNKKVEYINNLDLNKIQNDKKQKEKLIVDKIRAIRSELYLSSNCNELCIMEFEKIVTDYLANKDRKDIDSLFIEINSRLDKLSIKIKNSNMHLNKIVNIKSIKKKI